MYKFKRAKLYKITTVRRWCLHRRRSRSLIRARKAERMAKNDGSRTKNNNWAWFTLPAYNKCFL